MARNLYLKAGIGMYANDLSTVPTIPGTGIYWWKDETSGAGHYAFQVTELNRPLHIIDQEGFTAVCVNYWRPDSQGDDRPINLSIFYPFNRQSFTGVIVFEATTTYPRTQVMGFGSFGAHNFTVTVQEGYLWINDGTTNHFTGLKVSSQKSVVAVRCSATAVTVYLNSISNSFTMAAAPAGAFSGGEFNGSVGGWFNVYLADYYDTDIGEAACETLIDDAVAEYDIRTQHSKFIIVDGDINIQGFGVLENKTWWRRAEIPKSNFLAVHGFNGRTSTNAIPTLDDHPTFENQRESKWLFLRFPVSGAVSGQQLFNNLMEYYETERLKGLHRGVFFTLNMHSLDAERDTVNTLLRAEMSINRGHNAYVFQNQDNSKILVDVAAHPLIGSASPLNPIYWLDTFNTKDAAHQIVADLIKFGIPELYEADEILPPYRPIAAHLGQGVVQIYVEFPLESDDFNFEEFRWFEVESSMNLSGPYLPFSNNKFELKDGFVYNFPVGETAFLRIRAVGVQGAVSEWTQVKLGKISRPIVTMQCRAVRGSMIPAGALFTARKEPNRIAAFQAVDDVVFE